MGNCSTRPPAGGRRLFPSYASPAASKIYKLVGGLFEEYQSIDTTGAYDVEHFNIDTQQYLAIAMWGEVTLYRWLGPSPAQPYGKFVMHQSLVAMDGQDARDVEAFKIDGKQYLAVANNRDWSQFPARFSINSTLYRWEDSESDHWPDAVNHIHGAFVEHQGLLTTGARHIESFRVNETQYIAVANYHDGFKHDLESKVFQWDGTVFKEYQLLRTKGAVDFEAFRMDEFQFLAVANHYTWQSKLYRFDEDVGYFAEFQTFNTSNAQAFTPFAINGNQYLAVANKVSNSVVYRTPLPCRVTNSNQQPGAACTCHDGYEGHIEWLGSGASATGECRPAVCNIENSNQVAGPRCDCKPGYEGSIEWNGSIPKGQCKSSMLIHKSLAWGMILIGLPILCLITTAAIFVSRKYNFKRFHDELPEENPSGAPRTEAMSATVMGSLASNSNSSAANNLTNTV